MNQPTKKILNYVAVAFAIACVLAVGIIGRMERKGAFTKSPTAVDRLQITSEYYIDAKSPLERVPDDSLPLTIYIGEFKADDKGKVTFVEDGVKLVNFPQRVMNLAFRLEYIPSDIKPLMIEINKHITKWRNYGNDINAMFIDYRPKNPDFERYYHLTYELKRLSDEFKYHIAAYHVLPIIDAKWLDNPQYKDYIKLKEDASALYITLSDDDLKTKDTLEKLKDIGYVFKVILPSNQDKIDYDRTQLLQNNYLANVMKYIDGSFVKIERTPKLYALPKFFTSQGQTAQ